MEIERKYLIDNVPLDLSQFKKKEIEQGYLNTAPVLRLRRTDDRYTLTYKGSGLMAREEYNLPFDKDGYERLIKSCVGNIITKTRYLIPYGAYTIELDVFHGVHDGLVLAEVEFPNIEECNSFVPPEWFGEDVTLTGTYQNSRLCMQSNTNI